MLSWTLLGLARLTQINSLIHKGEISEVAANVDTTMLIVYAYTYVRTYIHVLTMITVCTNVIVTMLIMCMYIHVFVCSVWNKGIDSTYLCG